MEIIPMVMMAKKSMEKRPKAPGAKEEAEARRRKEEEMRRRRGRSYSFATSGAGISEPAQVGRPSILGAG